MPVEKVAIATVGGSGMGADAARRLRDDGFRIGVLSSSGKREALGESLGAFGVTGSNRSLDAIQQVVDDVIKRSSRIDVLVNRIDGGLTRAV